MNWQAPVSRRALFRVALGGGLTLALHGVTGGWLRRWLIAARLRQLLPHDLGAIAIGAAYLLQRPMEADPGRLVGEVLTSLPHRTVAPDLMDRPALEGLVRDGIRADFQTGRTVVLHGWIVSVTEARLAALVIVA